MDRCDGRTWWTNMMERQDGLCDEWTRRTDVTDRHGGQTWQTDMTDRHDRQTWWTDMTNRQMWRTDVTDRCYVQMWWTDVTDRHDGLTWQTDVTDGNDGQIWRMNWWTNMTTDVTDRCDRQTRRTDVTDGHDGRMRLTDLTVRRNHYVLFALLPFYKSANIIRCSHFLQHQQTNYSPLFVFSLSCANGNPTLNWLKTHQLMIIGSLYLLS